MVYRAPLACRSSLVSIASYRLLSAGFIRSTGSPYIAVILQAIIAALFVVMSFAGATVQEAYLILLDTTLLVYFLPYVYLFAAYAVIRSRGDAEKSDFLKSRMVATLTGVAGLVTTVIAMAMALVPPEETASVWLFEAKVIGRVSSLCGGGGGSLLGGNPEGHRALIAQSQSRRLKKK